MDTIMSANTVLGLLRYCAREIEKKFEGYRTSIIETEVPNWNNREFSSVKVRRAHLEILNEFETHGVYLIHFCVFPYFDDPAPIFGMDFVYMNGVLAGAFHDFSPMKKDHEMVNWFIETTKDIVPDKRRALPEWMSEVSSTGMISTVTIFDYDEVKEIVERLLANLDYYLERVGDTSGCSYIEEYNKYCVYQKKNPHIKHMLKSFGYDMEMVENFIEKYLFPEEHGLVF